MQPRLKPFNINRTYSLLPETVTSMIDYSALFLYAMNILLFLLTIAINLCTNVTKKLKVLCIVVTVALLLINVFVTPSLLIPDKEINPSKYAKLESHFNGNKEALKDTYAKDLIKAAIADDKITNLEYRDIQIEIKKSTTSQNPSKESLKSALN